MGPKVGIVGYRGYSGAELVRILERHRHVQPVLLEHREDHGHTAAIRHAKGPVRLACDPETVRAEGLVLVFLATPPEVSMSLAPAMLRAGARVVDLSGAFRLRTPETYTAWYKEPHTQPGLLAEAVYGLPEYFRDAFRRRGCSLPRAATRRPPTSPYVPSSRPGWSNAPRGSSATPSRASAAPGEGPASRP